MYDTWTDEQESAFASIMAAGNLERLDAIRLYRRNRENLSRSLAIAKANVRIPKQKVVTNGIQTTAAS